MAFLVGTQTQEGEYISPDELPAYWEPIYVQQVVQLSQDIATNRGSYGLKKIREAFQDDESNDKARGNMMAPPKVSF